MNASKLYGAVALDIVEWCSASTIQFMVGFLQVLQHLHRKSATTTFESTNGEAHDVLQATMF
jgi:hypothetical protein